MPVEITVLQQKYYSPVDNGLLALMATIKACSSQRYPCDKGDLGLALLTEMAYIKLGTQQILLLPGEPFPEVIYGGAAPAESSATGKGIEINPTPIIDIVGENGGGNDGYQGGQQELKAKLPHTQCHQRHIHDEDQSTGGDLGQLVDDDGDTADAAGRQMVGIEKQGDGGGVQGAGSQNACILENRIEMLFHRYLRLSAQISVAFIIQFFQCSRQVLALSPINAV